MRFFIKLAFRNFMRNKRRALIAGTAIGIGLASIIFTDALVIGMKNNMIDSATESFLGEAQIHRQGFRESYDVEKTIIDPIKVTDELSHDPLVSKYSRRALSFAMITSPANVSAVTMVGVDPPAEKYLSQVDDALIAGSYFANNDPHDILIGSELADLLEVELGSRIVLTVAQANTGDLSQEMFRVSGIYKFGIKQMDRMMAFILLPQAQRMLGIADNYHEIAVKFVNRDIAQDEKSPFWQKYSQNGNEAVSWTVLLPEVKAAFELSQFSTFIVGLILFGVVALGIINTLFMSLHERMFEFGVLRAVGTRASVMARLIVFEAGALAVFSIILGVILGLAITIIMMKVGIDYTGIEFSGVTFKVIYPVLEAKQFILYPIAVFIFTVLIGFYPALYAAKISPANAMRRSF